MKLRPWSWALLAAAVAAVTGLFMLNQHGEQAATREGNAASQTAASVQNGDAAQHLEEQPGLAGRPTNADDAGALLPAVVVLFDFDQFALRPAERTSLDRLATHVRSSVGGRLDAVGHADRIGTDAYNLKLSGRRAEAVKAYLVISGVDARLVRTQARGEKAPVTGDACKTTALPEHEDLKLIECLQPDRRVEIAVSGPD